MEGTLVEAGRALFEATPDACSVLEVADGGQLTIVAGNEALADTANLDVADLQGVAAEVVYPESMLAELRHHIGAVMEDGASRSVAVTRDAANSRQSLDMMLVPLTDHRVLACEHDRAQGSDANLEVTRVEALANIGSWVWHADDDTLELSDQLCRIVGLPTDDATTSRDAFLARIQPEDRRRVLATIRQVLSTGGSEEVWFRVVRPDGEVREVCGRGRALRDEGGRLVGALGTIQDSTERRQLERREQAMEQAAREQLRALELNDDVIQRLARAWLALDLGLVDDAREAIEEGIERVHAIMGELFAATARVQGGLRPGDLARRETPTAPQEGRA